jgi:hypothetical protein
MNSQAGQLKDTMGFFRLERQGAALRSAGSAQAAAGAQKSKAALRVAGNAALQAQPDESQFTRFT